MSLYFLDSNIIMYTLGGPHTLKTPCVKVLEKIRSAKIKVCTNTEIFQEILYRYYSLDKKVLAHQACDILKDIANPIFPITHEDIEKAMSLLKQYTIPVRDAVHAATMLNHNIRHILSTDIHFDNIHELTRIHPG